MLKKAKKAQLAIFFIISTFLILTCVLAVIIVEQNIHQVSDENTKKIMSNTVDNDAIEKYVESCVLSVIKDPVTKLALNGGTFNLSSSEFVSYDLKKHRVLCYSSSRYDGCSNILLTKNEMQDELSATLKPLLLKCINISTFQEKGYSVTTGKMTINTSIGLNNIIVYTHYPLKLTKEKNYVGGQDFTASFDTPFGELYQLATDILNSENINGTFNKDDFMGKNCVEYIVEKHRPYPNIVYSLTKITGKKNLTFRFAMKGVDTEGSVRELNNGPEFGSCLSNVDSMCFSNVDPQLCKKKGFKVQSSKDYICRISNVGNDIVSRCNPCKKTYSFEDERYDGRGRNSGESWCSYDSILYNKLGDGGMSYVGSRQYLHSCINGTEYVEECRDYREELCTEHVTSGNSKARCRLNRWDDCTACTTKDCCENSDLRDCSWSDWLTTAKKCRPIVPPGFKFWEGNGAEICSYATESKRCDDFSCPNLWIDHSAIYCYSMGDCGNYRNIEDKMTKSGFFNSDPTDDVRASAFPQDGLNMNPTEIGRKSLSLSLDTTKTSKVKLKLPEPVDIISSLMNAGMNYLDYLSRISISDIFANPSHLNVQVLDYSFCFNWAAPAGSKDCGECSQQFRPCTEYRCKSLGDQCSYEEINGVGKCTPIPKNSAAPAPKIIFDGSVLPENYSAEFMQVPVYDLTIDGVLIEPAVYPNILLTFKINTTEPTRCKLSYLPYISFNSLPPIWFGDGSLTKEHNISMSIPSEFDVPRKVYDMLNITKIEELSAILDDIPGTYKKYKNKYKMQLELYKTITGYDPIAVSDTFMQLALRVIQLKVDQMPRYKALAKLALQGIDEKAYSLYVSCIDKYGNDNVQPFFIKMVIASTMNETNPPKIVAINPGNITITDETEIPIEVYTDEVAQCRYDLIDEDYDVMTNVLDCPDSAYDRTSAYGGSYLCSGTIFQLPLSAQTLHYYFRCIDHPLKEESYYFNITSDGSIPGIHPVSRYFNFSSTDTLDVRYNMLDHSIIYSNGTLNLNIYMDEPMNCRNAQEKKEFELLGNEFHCRTAADAMSDLGVYVCSTTLTSGQQYIACQESSNQTRNKDMSSYQIQITRT